MWIFHAVPNPCSGSKIEYSTQKDPVFGINFLSFPGFRYPVSQNKSFLHLDNSLIAGRHSLSLTS